MKFFGFHLMPDQGLPPEHLESTDSSWVTLSNAVFDPARGHALYQRYIEELIAYDRAGFDGVCVNEHHQSAYGMMPSPDVIAGILVPQTRCAIAILGIGAEYHSFGMDPSQSRDRFYEAHDLIVAAWTRPGPCEWYGNTTSSAM